MRHSVGSLSRVPTNLRCTGRPSGENPDGRQIAGVPARFAGIVKRSVSFNGGSYAAARAVQKASRFAFGPTASPLKSGRRVHRLQDRIIASTDSSRVVNCEVT